MSLRGADVTGKVCRRCGDWKPIAELVKNKKYATGVTTLCKVCQADMKREFYKEHSDEINSRRRDNYDSETQRVANHRYYANNIAKFKQYAKTAWAETDKESERERHAEWRKNNPEKIHAIWTKRDRKRRATPRGRLDNAISRGVNRGLRKGSKAGRSTFSLLGYSSQDLMDHLERLFQPGMTWDNYGEVWEIDHKIPRSAFNYEAPEDIDFSRCWSLGNLQPLWKSENRSKRDKLELPFQPSLSLPVSSNNNGKIVRMA